MSVIYYLQHGEAGPVKIGYTGVSVWNRIRQLQACSPDLLVPRGVEPAAERSFELVRHKQFAHLRHRGEWFRHEGELAAFLNSRFPGYGQPSLEREYWHIDLVERVRAIKSKGPSAKDRFDAAAEEFGIPRTVAGWLCKENVPFPFPREKIERLCEYVEAA